MSRVNGEGYGEVTTKRAMPEGKRFKKGEVPNPKGRTKLPGPVKATRSMNRDQIAEIGVILLESSMDTLKELVRDPNATVIKRWAAAVAVKGIATGDFKSLDGLLNRVVGKVKDQVEIFEAPKTEIQRRMEAMTEEQRARFLTNAVKDLEDILDAE